MVYQHILTHFPWLHSYPIIYRLSLYHHDKKNGDRTQNDGILPSGKHTKNYGKSSFLSDKSTISMAFFNSKLFVYQRVYPY